MVVTILSPLSCDLRSLLIHTDPAFFANMGRLWGQATGRKGFAAMAPEQVTARAKGLAVRRDRAALRRRNIAVADVC